MLQVPCYALFAAWLLIPQEAGQEGTVFTLILQMIKRRLGEMKYRGLKESEWWWHGTQVSHLKRSNREAGVFPKSPCSSRFLGLSAPRVAGPEGPSQHRRAASQPPSLP